MATRTIRLGIVGAGRVALNAMAPAVHRSDNVTLYAAASRDPERARALQPEKIYTDYSALLRDPEIDAVYIATHNGLHCQQVLEALKNGKHVLCEKPLGVDEAECEQMLRAAETSRRVLLEGFMYRYHPQIDKARELIAAGAIGQLAAVQVSFHFRMSRPDDVRLRAAWGGGALLDVGCYCVNASRLFLGDSPTRTFARAAFDSAHGIDTRAHAILVYDKNRYAEISCGFEGGVQQRISLIGSDGTVDLDEPFIRWTNKSTLRLVNGRRETLTPYSPVDTFYLELQDFVSAIFDNSKPLLPLSDAMANARILDRLGQQMRSGENDSELCELRLD